MKWIIICKQQQQQQQQQHNSFSRMMCYSVFTCVLLSSNLNWIEHALSSCWMLHNYKSKGLFFMLYPLDNVVVNAAPSYPQWLITSKDFTHSLYFFKNIWIQNKGNLFIINYTYLFIYKALQNLIMLSFYTFVYVTSFGPTLWRQSW